MLVRKWKNWNPHALLVRMKNGADAMENSLAVQFLKKLNIELPYDLAIPLLGIHTKELKAGT